MSEDTGLHEKVGVLKGLMEGQMTALSDFKDEMRSYMEKDLHAHDEIKKEVHNLATNQAAEKVKLGAIVAVATVIVNQVISGFFKN